MVVAAPAVGQWAYARLTPLMELQQETAKEDGGASGDYEPGYADGENQRGCSCCCWWGRGCFKCCGGEEDEQPGLQRDDPATLAFGGLETQESIWPANDEPEAEQLLDDDGRVACAATIRVIFVDPKRSKFQVRMQCQWAFRTHNLMSDTELSFRGVPGIRMPGLNVVVEESRIWKDLSQSAKAGSSKVAWRGYSIFLMDGYKKFYVEDFPFDRQVINLQQLDFVWRTNKDDDDFYNTMKVVWLKLVTCSMLSEWRTPKYVGGQKVLTADVSADSMRDEDSTQQSPTCSRFQIELFIERRHEFYVRQIFFVSCMITISACTPLGTPPDDMGDRLSVYGGGLLALVAFKYGIMEHLPSVPYSTFTDNFLIYQILTVTVCTFESLIVYRFRHYEHFVDMIENCTLVVVVMAWILAFLYTYLRKPHLRTDWEQVYNKTAHEDQLLEVNLPNFMASAQGRSSRMSGDLRTRSVSTRQSSKEKDKKRRHLQCEIQ